MAKRIKKVQLGEQFDLGKVGYVRLPGGEVLTSGRYYTVRHEGRHVAFGTDEAEFDGVAPLPLSGDADPVDPAEPVVTTED